MITPWRRVLIFIKLFKNQTIHSFSCMFFSHRMYYFISSHWWTEQQIPSLYQLSLQILNLSKCNKILIKLSLFKQQYLSEPCTVGRTGTEVSGWHSNHLVQHGNCSSVCTVWEHLLLLTENKHWLKIVCSLKVERTAAYMVRKSGENEIVIVLHSC